MLAVYQDFCGIYGNTVLDHRRLSTSNEGFTDCFRKLRRVKHISKCIVVLERRCRRKEIAPDLEAILASQALIDHYEIDG